MKNIELIKKMTVTELAEFLVSDDPCKFCIAKKGNCDQKCVENIEEWLKQETIPDSVIDALGVIDSFCKSHEKCVDCPLINCCDPVS